MEKHQLYRYIVEWEEDDQVFVARVAEFPSLSAHGKSQEQALTELKSVVALVLEDLEQAKEAIPEPLSTRKYSGRFQVRLPKELHRRLVTEATEEGISLNQLALLKLGASLTHTKQTNRP